jgi:hypothetical protein
MATESQLIVIEEPSSAAAVAGPLAQDDTRSTSDYQSPIYLLPNELVRDLLLLAASENDHPFPYCISSTFNAVAKRVCHNWRDICLETGDFWTIIDFSDEPPFNRTLLHIQRAKNRPLTIRADRHTLKLAIAEMIPILQSVRSRVGRLDMDTSSLLSHFILSHLVLDQQFKPRETRLSLYNITFDWGGFELIQSTSWFLHSVVRVHSLVLRQPPMRGLIPIAFDLTILHLYSIKYDNPSQIWTVLESCSELEELLIESCSHDYSRRFPDAIEHMDDTKIFPVLRQLTLAAVSQTILTKFYSTVVAPALRLIDIQHPTQMSLDPLSTFLHRSLQDCASYPSLKHVVLRQWWSGHDSFFQGVSADAFHSLHITSGSLPDVALIALTPGADCDCGLKACTHYECPNLSEMFLTNLTYCSHTRLAAMVERRALTSNPASRMLVIDVRNCCPFQKLVNPLPEVEQMGAKIKACGVTGVWDWRFPE